MGGVVDGGRILELVELLLLALEPELIDSLVVGVLLLVVGETGSEDFMHEALVGGGAGASGSGGTTAVVGVVGDVLETEMLVPGALHFISIFITPDIPFG